MYICLLEALGLAQVKKVAPTPRFTEAKPAVDSETLQAVITHRYDVLAKYAKSLKRTYAEELGKLRRLAPHDAHVLKNLKRWLHRDEKSLCETERANLKQGLAKSRALHTVYSMRAELASLWERSSVVARPARASVGRTGATRRSERYPPARGVLAPDCALLRVEIRARGSGKPKKPAFSGFFHGFQPVGFSGSIWLLCFGRLLNEESKKGGMK